MNKQLLIYWVVCSLIGGFNLWLSIKLADPDNDRNTFIKAVLINLPFALFSFVSVVGFVALMVIIGILLFTIYDMELGQTVGTLLLFFIINLIWGGLYLLLKHFVPSFLT